jgi:hypothetical protein
VSGVIDETKNVGWANKNYDGECSKRLRGRGVATENLAGLPVQRAGFGRRTSVYVKY